MASSGSTSISVTTYDTLKFNWVQVGQSTANNYTTINWSLQLIAGSAGQIISSASKSWSVTVGGTKYSGTNSVAVANNATVTLASGSTTIPHNDDGSKSFDYSFSQEFSITFAGVSIGTKSGSGTGVLNTIPRATTPVLPTSSVFMGSSITISTPGASPVFTHDLAYSFAGEAYKTIGSGVTTSYSWTVPRDLASSIPNSTSGTVTIRCITKKGSTIVGTKTALLTIKVPTDIIPSISTVSSTEASTGTITSIGAYVQTKSKLKVTITAAGAYGSTPKSYSTTFEGKVYSGSSFTTDVIRQSGDITMVTKVTDSRGRTVTKSTTISALAYESPKITRFHVARRNEKGEADPNGELVVISRAYRVTSLNNKNTATMKIECKPTDGSTWTQLYSGSSLSLDDAVQPSDTFSTNYQWDFKLTVTDAFKAEASYTTFIPSGAVIFDIKADGKGLAFFKTSTKDGVEIAGELPDSAINLTTNANLNDLTTPGFYVIPTTAVSATISNMPYDDNATASIKVERTGDGMVRQILQKSTKDNGVIYERGYGAGTWGSWSVVYSGEGKVLWSGTTPLSDTNTITLSEAISDQQSGIVAVFSPYNSSTNAALTYGFSCHFIPKQLLKAVVPSINSVLGVTVVMAEGKFASVATKFLRITDTTINGSADNTVSGTANGITYNNNRYALRYVIGV